MRTRTLRANSSPTRASRLPGLLFTASVVALFLTAGCGGGGGISPPVVSAPVIVTNPSPITYTGGTATLTVNVTAPAGINNSTVKADIIDSNGVSIINGPQLMTAHVAPANSYTYPFTLPNNLQGTANKVYTARVTAADLNGNAMFQPFVAGTVSVPFPPAPPGGP